LIAISGLRLGVVPRIKQRCVALLGGFARESKTFSRVCSRGNIAANKPIAQGQWKAWNPVAMPMMRSPVPETVHQISGDMALRFYKATADNLKRWVKMLRQLHP